MLIQRGCRSGLADKPALDIVVASQVVREEFEGHDAGQPGVLGFVNDTHTAGPDLFEYLVVGDSFPDQNVSIPILGQICRKSGFGVIQQL
jgi:hypothetical protein